MRAYLQEANDDLLYQVEVVQELLGLAKVAGELTPYVGQISRICAELRQQASATFATSASTWTNSWATFWPPPRA